MSSLRLPWDVLPPRQAKPVARPEPAVPAEGTKGAKAQARRPRVQRIDPHCDPAAYWHLVVHGPQDAVERFVAAARGAGSLPWVLDGAAIEEDLFLWAVARRDAGGHSVQACRLLARQVRQAVLAHHQRVCEARDGRSCPLDFHRLRPLPAALLAAGPAAEAPRAWMRRHWGLDDLPRKMARLPQATAGRRLPRGHGSVVYGFFADGWRPEPLLAHLTDSFPALTRLMRIPIAHPAGKVLLRQIKA
ncbi:hypothetical protein, partial [Gluconacetobacter sacchari]